MKKINLAIAVSLFLLSCQFNSAKAQLQIGKIENSVPVVTANKAALLNKYNTNLLSQSGINGNFTDVRIVQYDGRYFLVFSGAQFKSSLLLKAMAGSDNSATYFYEDDNGGHVSCTTSECASEPKGCVPSPVGLACTPCDNKGKCTKTVSAGSLLE